MPLRCLIRVTPFEEFCAYHKYSNYDIEVFRPSRRYDNRLISFIARTRIATRQKRTPRGCSVGLLRGRIPVKNQSQQHGDREPGKSLLLDPLLYRLAELVFIVLQHLGNI